MKNKPQEELSIPNSKILVVDDEPFNVDYLQQELEELDYEIVTASNVAFVVVYTVQLELEEVEKELIHTPLGNSFRYCAV